MQEYAYGFIVYYVLVKFLLAHFLVFDDVSTLNLCWHVIASLTVLRDWTDASLRLHSLAEHGKIVVLQAASLGMCKQPCCHWR